ncbi:UNVERIFIED_CONTAM: hypothetical protein FKN15_060438 [Acipenser sinensis]
MGKKSTQRQRQKQQQQQLPSPPQTLWEDPASLSPWCSWCGKEDHRWRSCPDGPPADWCGRCEADGHSWAGCPHNPDQEQLQTLSSAATPPLPASPPSPPSWEIWEWLVHPETDLPHDLPIAIRTLWRRDGERWEEWERRHHPVSLQDIASMVLDYLEVDMGGVPVIEVEEWCAHCCQYGHEEDTCQELDLEPDKENSGEEVELLSQEPEGVEPPSREPEGVEPPSREPEGVEPPSREPEGVEPPSREPEGVEPPSREPEGVEPPSREPEGEEPPSREPEGQEPQTQEPEGEKPRTREPEGEKADAPPLPLHMLLRGAQCKCTRL